MFPIPMHNYRCVIVFLNKLFIWDISKVYLIKGRGGCDYIPPNKSTKSTNYPQFQNFAKKFSSFFLWFFFSMNFSNFFPNWVCLFILNGRVSLKHITIMIIHVEVLSSLNLLGTLSSHFINATLPKDIFNILWNTPRLRIFYLNLIGVT